MKATTMNVPLSVNHFLERAGRLFGEREIVARMPDKSLHRYRYKDFYRRAPKTSTGKFLKTRLREDYRDGQR